MTERKTQGQLDYEQDCQMRPCYPDGRQRKTWDELDRVIQQNWERYSK